MLGILLVVLGVLPGQVEARPPEQLAREVRRLVRQLDADQLAQRDAAEKALIDLGPDILGLLPRVTPRTPAEVKERLTRVTKALETASAEAATKPTRVTLEGEMPLADALAALERQTGNKVVGHEELGGTVKLQLKDVVYWEALDKVLDQAGLNINPFGGESNALTVEARPEEQLPRFGHAGYSGLFRFQATRVEAVRDLRNPRMAALRVRLDVSWEPRMTPISLSQPLADLAAVDDAGNPLPVDGPQGERNASGKSDLSSIEMDLPFVLPDRAVRKIASLQGTLTALVPGRVETFEFSDLASARDEERQRAGVTVTLEQLRKNMDLYEVRIRVRFDEAANALESHRGWIYENDAFLIDSNGQRIDNLGYQTTRQEVNEVGLAYLFDMGENPKSYKFVYRTPALIVRLPVEYQLKDIELP